MSDNLAEFKQRESGGAAADIHIWEINSDWFSKGAE
jgi:hypothetical protein